MTDEEFEEELKKMRSTEIGVLQEQIRQEQQHVQLYREKVEALSKELGNEVAKAFNRGFELGREYERERI